MFDRGFFLTRQAVARQLAAMPAELYLVRLIHAQRRVPLPGERLWTQSQLKDVSTIRFLRARNSQGWDVYLLPYAGSQNAGYLLVDLDVAPPAVIKNMQANGHEPCVVLRTSPGHLQAWVCLGSGPLEPAVATAAAQLLARQYGGDSASADWRHLGRLAGFTNQKPTRCTWTGLAPWVTVAHARAGRASRADKILQMARTTAQARSSLLRVGDLNLSVTAAVNHASDPQITATQALEIYRGCMQRWHILERFPQPDWSIVDLWVARHLLSQHTPAARVKSILQLASPQFPRRHGDPDDYLRRTLARAGFPAPGGELCDFAARGAPSDRGM